MPSLTLKNVTKKWKDFVAVNSVSLNIEDGEFIVLLGPSGCGKTTTMRLIDGLEEITDGEIYIGDELVNDIDPRKRDVSMVFQNYSLFPHMSIRNNLAYPLKIKKIPRETQTKLIHEVAELVELSELLDRKPAELSGGQRQRVALGRALIRKPRLFLMDEPLSNLDAILRLSMRSELKNLHYKLKVTTIYVTHDQVEAMTLADRIAVMNKGDLLQFDKPNNIYDQPSNSFVAGFIGNPAMNLVDGAIQDGEFKSAFFNFRCAIPYQGKITLGIRPQNIKICSDQDAFGSGRIFSSEMTGEYSLINLKAADKQLCIKEDRNFLGKIDELIHFNFEQSDCYFFDSETGDRLHLMEPK
ncbi:MAG: ABC transporter ATP-binding protein [bacterium]